MIDPMAPSSPVKDAIDCNSGRFEFLKQTLTLGSAGIAGIAALFTDPTRIPADLLSKLAMFLAGTSLAFVVYYAVMGLSVYANLLAATANEAAGKPLEQPASSYFDGLRDHARGVVVALFATFIAIGLFSVNRLFFLPTVGTAESAIDAASAFVGKETRQPADTLYLMRFETDNDAFMVTYFVTATNSEATVRVSKKDGSVIRLTQDKRPVPAGAKQP
jgi:hypothetical protein